MTTLQFQLISSIRKTLIVSSYNRYSAGGEEIFRSLDGGATWKPVFATGKTWQPSPTMPAANSQHGHISVSADGNTWVWTPQRSAVFVTHDRGKTWQPAKGIAENVRIIADKVNPQKFYGLD